MAVYNQAVLPIDPLYLQPKSYDARSDRKWFSSLLSPGVEGSGDGNVTYAGTLLNLTIAGGVFYILGQNIVDQGTYREFMSTTQNVAAPAADATNPRIDTVIMRVMDNAADASGFNECRLEVVPGTPTAGATLANLNGKNALTALGEASKSFIVLAYILVPAGATVLTNTATNVKDARVRSTVGSGASSVAGGVPIGASVEWNSTTLPPSQEGTYLVEDGSAISRTTYLTLFNRIGTGAGTGDGSTTFNIPDSRGRMPVGYAPSGGHTDVSTLFANDGVAVGFRRPKHRTSNALSHNLTLPQHVHGSPNPLTHDAPSATTGHGAVQLDNFSDGQNLLLLASTTGNATTLPAITGGITGSIGTNVANDPLDSSAYIVKNKILRVA